MSYIDWIEWRFDLKVWEPLCCIIGSTNPCRITRKAEQTKYVRMYIEEFILVDIWIHCCTVHETGH